MESVEVATTFTNIRFWIIPGYANKPAEKQLREVMKPALERAQEIIDQAFIAAQETLEEFGALS